MSKYSEGDVVICHFPILYDNPDGPISKIRPAVIKAAEPDKNTYVVIQVTSKNRSGQNPGKWVPRESQLGKTMGLLLDSFINYNYQVVVKEFHIIRKIGNYPFIDELS